MFHLAAWRDTITDVANDQVNAITDQIFNINANNFLLNQDMYVPALMVLGTTVARARLSSPSLRAITQPQLYPIHPTINPTTDPNYIDYLTRPLTVRSGEDIQLQVTGNSTVSTACIGLGWFLSEVDPVPNKEQITLYGTSTTACVANTWTDITYTLADQIPSGVYTLITSRHVSANAVAHRWILDSTVWRPGMSSDTILSARQPLWMPVGVLGTMGQFRNTSLPRLQVLSTSTDNAHDIFLKVCRMGN